MKKLYTLLLALIAVTTFQAQIINIPDANFKAKLLAANSTNYIASTAPPDSSGVVNTYTQIDINNDGEIQISEALAIKWLSVTNCTITDLTGIQYFSNLQSLNCSNNQLTNLNISNLTNLKIFYCENNHITNLNLSNLVNIKDLKCDHNQLTILNLSGLNNLISLDCSNNQLTNLDVSNRLYLNLLYCNSNSISNLNLTNDTNLTNLDFSSNQITNIDLSLYTNLKSLGMGSNPYSSVININSLVNLYSLDISNLALNVIPLTNNNANIFSNLHSLSTSNTSIGNVNYGLFPNLILLNCNNTGLSILNLNNLIHLQYLNCSNNQITTLDASPLINLELLDCSSNSITNLNINGLINLYNINCSNNQLTTINFSGLIGITDIDCRLNQITNIDFTSLINLNSILCGNNQFTNLDFSLNPIVDLISCSYNPNLISLNIKNGSISGYSLCPNLQGCTNLKYICADENEITNVQYIISFFSLTNCHVNSYCSFSPGGAFYSIKGNNRYDYNNNGCDLNDVIYPNLKLSFTDGNNTGNLITDTTGFYQYVVQAGTQTFTPTLENPNYFNISPTSASVTFPGATSPYIQDFCITPNGVHNDIEVSILPLDDARPGFDSHYKIIYKNKGNTVQSGSILLIYESALSNIIYYNPNLSFQAASNLTWNFSNLLPFETRIILFTIHINSPTDNPPVNSGNVINYYVTATGATNDETPSDNYANLAQTVFNSYDPNEKTCTEGTTVSPSMVGQYVHYIIHFENDGTANAQNIVVKDMIDTSKFDISTLVPLTGSANFTTRITNTNQVEFIFQNINLPFVAGTNGGYVAFKIKTKPTLVVEDTFSNSASIYFDYNYPIVTNTFITTIQALATQDFEFSNYFSIYPSPAKNILNLETKSIIDVKTISIYNIQGQVVTIIPNAENVSTIDVSNLKTGTYFIKVTTDKGSANRKFIKE